MQQCHHLCNWWLMRIEDVDEMLGLYHHKYLIFVRIFEVKLIIKNSWGTRMFCLETCGWSDECIVWYDLQERTRKEDVGLAIVCFFCNNDQWAWWLTMLSKSMQKMIWQHFEGFLLPIVHRVKNAITSSDWASIGRHKVKKGVANIC